MTTPAVMGSLEAIVGRRSVRRFLATAVPRVTVEAILASAARAPSGMNTQPWHVHVVAGKTLARVSRAVLAAAANKDRDLEYPYMPDPLPEPYMARRRAIGYALYQSSGIDRHDYPARERAYLRNFEFFGAPVGLFFTIERILLHGSWLDIGCFLQNVMIAARAFGLETCPQQSWCEYGPTVRSALGISTNRLLVTGMALGHADPLAPENGMRSERSALDQFATFDGF